MFKIRWEVFRAFKQTSVQDKKNKNKTKIKNKQTNQKTKPKDQNKTVDSILQQSQLNREVSSANQILFFSIHFSTEILIIISAPVSLRITYRITHHLITL